MAGIIALFWCEIDHEVVKEAFLASCLGAVIVPRPTLLGPTFLFEKLVLIRMSARAKYVARPNARFAFN